MRSASLLESLSDRSYLLQNGVGNIIRRNRVPIQATPEPTTPINTAPSEGQDHLTTLKKTRCEQGGMPRPVVLAPELD